MEELIDTIYKAALEEHSEFKQVSPSEMKEAIRIALKEIEQIEAVATHPNISQKSSIFWVFSGAGTYHGVVMGEKYSKYEWAKNMDRERLDYAVQLARVSRKLYQHHPVIIYNGGDNQNLVLREMIRNNDIDLSPEDVIIMGQGIRNTVDQVQTFVLPDTLHKVGNEIGLIAHTPQLMRILHMLGKYKTVPQDMPVKLFPIPVSPEGREVYTSMEIKGLLYYLFIAKNATLSSYPYVI